MVFAHMPEEKAARLRALGAEFHDWLPPRDGRVLVRIATAFATPEADVAKFIDLAKG
jgi:threonine aldolase